LIVIIRFPNAIKNIKVGVAMQSLALNSRRNSSDTPSQCL